MHDLENIGEQVLAFTTVEFLDSAQPAACHWPNPDPEFPDPWQSFRPPTTPIGCA